MYIFQLKNVFKKTYQIWPHSPRIQELPNEPIFFQWLLKWRKGQPPNIYARRSDREASNRHRLASKRLPTILDVEVVAARGGHPPIPRDVRALISRMSRENPLWSAPRIHGELLKLGIEVSEATVSKYLAWVPKPPSQTWRTILRNHAKAPASIDFFVLPTGRADCGALEAEPPAPVLGRAAPPARV